MLIDSLKFSREQQATRGRLPVEGMARLRNSLYSEAAAVPRGDDAGQGDLAGSGSLNYEVSGGTDSRDRPVLRLKVSGTIGLQCQRCLQLLAYDLALDSTLRLVPAARLEAEMSDDPDEPDCVAASAEFDVAALIEDEILLALPAYPRHEAGKCGGAPATEFASGAGRSKVTAFSALEQLSGLKQKSI